MSYGTGGANASLAYGLNAGGVGLNFGGVNNGSGGFGFSGPSASFGIKHVFEPSVSKELAALDIELSLKSVSQSPNRCGFACAESLDDFAGGARTETNFWEMSDSPSNGDTAGNIINNAGWKSTRTQNLRTMIKEMGNGNPSFVSIRNPAGGGHGVLLKRVQMFSKTDIRFTIMDPARGIVNYNSIGAFRSVMIDNHIVHLNNLSGVSVRINPIFKSLYVPYYKF